MAKFIFPGGEYEVGDDDYKSMPPDIREAFHDSVAAAAAQERLKERRVTVIDSISRSIRNPSTGEHDTREHGVSVRHMRARAALLPNRKFPYMSGGRVEWIDPFTLPEEAFVILE